MFILEHDEIVNRLIAITKSDSGINGPELANAHMELGKLLGLQLTRLNPNDTTIVAILRGGIFFAEGMYFSMGCKFQLFDPKNQKYVRPNTKCVIIVDSVINTGNTVRDIIDDNTLVACCVINEDAVPLFDTQLYAIRVSKNSFVGADVKRQAGHVGPDTTMRLFNLL